MEPGKKSWKEFQETGLLWWINRILHTFGWAITLVQMEDGTVTEAYPARCRFRGFAYEDEEKGFKSVSNYMASEAEELKKEANS
jgi:hypothetical protein